MHDYVMMWNSIALELNRRDHTGKMNAKNNKGPTLSSRALAIFHLAMHDAFFGRQNVQSVFSGIDGLKTPTMTYLPAALIASLTPPAGGASTEGAAVSGAASTALLELYPDFKSIVYEALNGFDFNPAMSGNPAFEFGVKVAKAILADRENDGARDLGAVPEMERFWRHREDPSDPGQGLLGAVYGTTKLFSASDIPTIADHPVPRSTAYDAAHDLVRDKGVKIGGSRTPYETLLGYYWAYDGASQIGTPPRQYNQVVRQIIAQNVNGPARPAASARLLTLVNVAMADAGIAAWYHKYVYQLWRPILGIREYDNSFWQGKGYEANSFGLHKRCDPWWTPLGSPRTNEPGRRSFTPPSRLILRDMRPSAPPPSRSRGASLASRPTLPTISPSISFPTNSTDALSPRTAPSASYIGDTIHRCCRRCSTMPSAGYFSAFIGASTASAIMSEMRRAS